MARCVWLAAAVSLIWIGESGAQPAGEGPQRDEVIVFGRAIDLIGEARAASDGVVGYADLSMRPIARVGELVEVIPGLIATQHSGTGKANQYFLRGFNLDHGTDFAVAFDGAPVNFRTHGHGQGYLDLNFIIPEVIERVEFRKGPYHADVGDFGAAASAGFKTYDRLSENVAEATVGEFGYRRGLVAGSRDVGRNSLLFAGEAVFYDGPFALDEDLEKYNAFLKVTHEGAAADWRLSFSAYDARWSSTDQVPLRAIADGRIDRLGLIDPDLGGDTKRIAVNGGVSTESFEASAYALYYDFSLFSNFTYFASDPVNGDEFEQADERFVFGGSARKTFDLSVAGRPAEISLGGELRYDDIADVGLFNTVARERFNTVRSDDVRELSLGGYAEVAVALTERLRAVVGLRGDFYDVSVSSSLAPNSGDANDGLVSPKAALAFRASDTIELYANYGRGFHSNDARGATIAIDPSTLDPVDPVDLLVKADGAEVGARFERGGVNATIAGFWLDLDSELVFVGDAGTTEPNAGTRRFGVEFSSFWQAADWLALDVEAAYTHARFKETAPDDRIPLAIATVVSAGATLSPIRNLTSTLRVRRFGSAPLIEDGSVRSDPTTLVNLGLAYDLGRVRLALDVFNLLNSRDADITYFFESQLPGEPAPVADIHLHPVEPRQVRGSIAVKF